MNDWQQALFDLMANERVYLIVRGEVGDVVASLQVEREGIWVYLGVVDGEETADNALRELMKQVQQRLADER